MSINAETHWYVSPLGNDTTGDGSESIPWRTIQYAINQSANGDTIKVMDDDIEATDDYIENVIVNKSVSIEKYDNNTTKPRIKGRTRNTRLLYNKQ